MSQAIPWIDPLTPWITPLLSQLIFDRRLPPAAVISYARLLAYAWRNQYQHTAALDFSETVLPLLNLSRSQALHHLRLLRAANLLTWTTNGCQQYVFEFNTQPYSLPAPGASIPQFATTGLPDTDVDDGDLYNKPDQVTINPTSTTASENLNAPAGWTAPVLPPEPTRFPDLTTQPAEFSGLASERTAPEGQATSALQDNPADQSSPPSPSGPLTQKLSEALTARACLARAGVWRDAAERIERTLEQNARRQNPYLPDLGDVLGWMAYCFAYQKQNKIAAPSAVLATNLNANRRCPETYRPEPICRGCRRVISHCLCPGQPTPYYPRRYLDFAFNCDYDDESESFWGVCNQCHASPCQCPPDEP